MKVKIVPVKTPLYTGIVGLALENSNLLLRNLTTQYKYAVYDKKLLADWQTDCRLMKTYLNFAFENLAEAAEGIRQAQLMLEHNDNDDGR